MSSFQEENLKVISDALEIAEDATGNFYKFSLGQWKRHRYDVRTVSCVDEKSNIHSALAVLLKSVQFQRELTPVRKPSDFYLICLQDQSILRVLDRDSYLTLMPLLIYVFTHELVHIVRFNNFYERFDASEVSRIKEEEIVHKTTFEILKDFSLPKLDYVLGAYHGHRICDMVSLT